MSDRLRGRRPRAARPAAAAPASRVPPVPYRQRPASVPVVDVNPATQARAVVHDHRRSTTHKQARTRLPGLKAFVIIQRAQRLGVTGKLEDFSADYRPRTLTQDGARILAEIIEPSPHRRCTHRPQTPHRGGNLRRRMPRRQRAVYKKMVRYLRHASFINEIAVTSPSDNRIRSCRPIHIFARLRAC